MSAPRPSPFAIAGSGINPHGNTDNHTDSTDAMHTTSTLEPFPTYIEPAHFNAVTMNADSHLGLANMRALTASQRTSLREGEAKLNIYFGDELRFSMPWRLFQAVSTLAAEIRAAHPVKWELHLHAGFSPNPFRHILDWLAEVSIVEKFHLMKRRNNVREDVAICRAARLLGMMEYAQHIFNHYWAMFNNVTPNFDDLSALEGQVMMEEHAGLEGYDAEVFMKCVVKRLAKMVVKNELDNSAEMAQYFQEHPRWMEEVADVVAKMTGGKKDAEGGHDAKEKDKGGDTPKQSKAKWQEVPKIPVDEFPSLPTPKPAMSVQQPQGIQKPQTTQQAAPPLSLPDLAAASKLPNAAQGGPVMQPSTPSLSTGTSANTNNGGKHAGIANHPTNGAKAFARSVRPPRQRSITATQASRSFTMPSQLSTAQASGFASLLEGSEPDTSPFPVPSSNAATTNRNVGRTPPSQPAAPAQPSTSPETTSQGSSTQDPLPPSQSTSNDSALIAAAKALFTPPQDPEAAANWIKPYARALQEQNMKFREERHRAMYERGFTFSNPNWADSDAHVDEMNNLIRQTLESRAMSSPWNDVVEDGTEEDHVWNVTTHQRQTSTGSQGLTSGSQDMRNPWNGAVGNVTEESSGWDVMGHQRQTSSGSQSLSGYGGNDPWNTGVPSPTAGEYTYPLPIPDLNGRPLFSNVGLIGGRLNASTSNVLPGLGAIGFTGTNNTAGTSALTTTEANHHAELVGSFQGINLGTDRARFFQHLQHSRQRNGSIEDGSL